MQKKCFYIIDGAIYILCFATLLSFFFKIVSLTPIDNYIYINAGILILVWVIGLLFAGRATPHLYRWILQLRHL